MAVSKTELGIRVMKDRSISLSAQQRSALILCDGKRSAQDVVNMTSAVGVTLQDIEALAALGLISVETTAATQVFTPAPAPVPLAPSVLVPKASEVSPQVATSEIDFNAAVSAAITLCSDLGFKGFSLNMALAGVDSMEKLQKLAPEIRRAAGDAKYKPLHTLIFGKAL